MATILVPDPATMGRQFYLESEDFPDASTQDGQDTISAAIAALNPEPAYTLVQVITAESVEVDTASYPVRVEHVYYTLQDWFASL
ncbi:hypothetical protein PBI_JOSHKAYV_8 [Mycobacterium phage JoshKayV]|uniref:Uncharacterized protein n=1 Tax=Mycobacterium phage JoshKayV TaxID=2024294 RepID=A0A249XTN6_9CAUD|nr:hypothetical protein KIY86_gp08 [Mycobacterium phage JoshKayV]ASZ75349.1 hypothetical protein PBI_JOSHKAYV_8 [Mycobacterium phage JoshKayV]